MKYEFKLIIRAWTKNNYFAWPYRESKTYDWAQGLWWEKDGKPDSPFSESNLELHERAYA